MAETVSKVSRIGVLTSGGDAPGMNSAIRAVARTAHSLGIECIGVRRGYHGLITGDMEPLTPQDVSGITSLGGTMLYTARSAEFRTPEGVQRAADICRFRGIDGLVCVGGDGTFRGALELSKYGISVCGIPATIDNDIACTSYTIGFDTACNTAIECIDKLNDTMKSHERCSVVEVMGNRAGFLALYVGLAVGASAVLVPEKPIDYKRDVIRPIREGQLHGRTNYAVIVAEGAAHATEVAKIVAEETGMDTRATIIGHVQRGGRPTVRDRVLAADFGYNAVKVLAEGMTNKVICYDGQKMFPMDIVEALKMKKDLGEHNYSMMETLRSGM